MLPRHNCSCLPTFWSLGYSTESHLLQAGLRRRVQPPQGMRDWSVSPQRGGQCPYCLRWATGMKYLWTMEKITFISNIYFPGQRHRPPLPDNPRESPHGFKLFAEPCGHISCWCHLLGAPQEGIWQNYMLLKKKEKYSIFLLPKGNQSTRLSTALTPEAWQGSQRDFSSRGCKDNDNFQYDWSCNCKNDCSSTQKHFHFLGWSLPFQQFIIIIIIIIRLCFLRGFCFVFVFV